MVDEDTSNTNDFKRELNFFQCENKKMEKDFTCIQKWFDEKMVQETLKHNRTVEDYYRLMNKCKVYSENVERSRAGNNRYKLLAQRLKHIIQTSIGCSIQNTNTNIVKGCNNDDISSFEKICAVLQGELRLYEQRIKDAQVFLTETKGRLAAIEEDKIRLIKLLDEATSFTREYRIRRDRNEMDLKAMMKRLEVGLVGLKEKKRQTVDILQANIEQLTLASDDEERSEVERINELLKENALLSAELDSREKEETILKTRVFQLREETSGSQRIWTSWDDEYDLEDDGGTHMYAQCRLGRGNDDEKDD